MNDGWPTFSETKPEEVGHLEKGKVKIVFWN